MTVLLLSVTPCGFLKRQVAQMAHDHLPAAGWRAVLALFTLKLMTCKVVGVES